MFDRGSWYRSGAVKQGVRNACCEMEEAGNRK